MPIAIATKGLFAGIRPTSSDAIPPPGVIMRREDERYPRFQFKVRNMKQKNKDQDLEIKIKKIIIS